MIEYGVWSGEVRGTGLNGVPGGRILRHVFDPTRGERGGMDYVTMIVGTQSEMGGTNRYLLNRTSRDQRSEVLTNLGLPQGASWFPVYGKFFTPSTEGEYLAQPHITDEIAAITGLTLMPRGLIT